MAIPDKSDNGEQRGTNMLRAQAEVLLLQARAQSTEMPRALNQANGNPALRARLEELTAHVDGVVAELSGAVSARAFPLHLSDLMSLQTAVSSGDVQAAVSEAANQATHAFHVATRAQLAEVAASAAETRHEVETLGHDLFEKRIFDRYLHFSSTEDETAFRQREADAQRYISAQLARKMPEGDLNASGGTISHMLDAHAHGAGDSPEFAPRWNSLVAKTERQYAAMKAAGQSTEEFDKHVGDGVRRFLKDEKHLPDAEIERRLSSAANPLDAAKSSLKDDRASHLLNHKIELTVKPASDHQTLPVVVESADVAMPQASQTDHLDAVRAKLKAAGIKMADGADAAPTHGLTVTKPATGPEQSPSR